MGEGGFSMRRSLVEEMLTAGGGRRRRCMGWVWGWCRCWSGGSVVMFGFIGGGLEAGEKSSHFIVTIIEGFEAFRSMLADLVEGLELESFSRESSKAGHSKSGVTKDFFFEFGSETLNESGAETD